MSRILGSRLSLLLGLGVFGTFPLAVAVDQPPALSWLWEGDYALFGFGFEESYCADEYYGAETLITHLDVTSDSISAEVIPSEVSVPEWWSFYSTSIDVTETTEPRYSSGYLIPALGRLFIETMPDDFEVGSVEYNHGFLAANRGSFLWAETESFDTSIGPRVDLIPGESETTECLPESFNFLRFGIPIVPIPAPGQVAGDWQGISLGARLTPESEFYDPSMTRFEVSFDAADLSGIRAVTQAVGNAAVDSGVFDWLLSEDSTAIEISNGLGPTFHVSLSYGLMVGLQVSLIEPSPLTLSRDGEFDYEFEYYIAIRQGDEIPRSGLVGTYGWSMLSAAESELYEIDFHLTDLERGILNLYENGRFRLFSTSTEDADSSLEERRRTLVEGGTWEQTGDKVVLSFVGENDGEQFSLMAGDGGNVLIGLQQFDDGESAESELFLAIQLAESELGGGWNYFPDAEPESPYGYETEDWEDNGYGIDSFTFGEFSSFSDFPWITHTEHGSLYCHGEGGVSYWFYDYTMGTWLYTSLELYPNFFSSLHNWWLYYLEGTGYYGDGRYFWRYPKGTEMPEGEWILTGYSTVE
jgi:hypothetical protein